MRGRGEANSFNVIRLEGSRIVVTRHAWSGSDRAFAAAWRGVFHRTATGWEATT
jgi:hypothetical protein